MSRKVIRGSRRLLDKSKELTIPLDFCCERDNMLSKK